MHMKRVYISLFTLALVFGLAVTFSGKLLRKNMEIISEELCFVKEQKTIDGTSSDIFAAKVNREGDIVTGEIKSIPSFKDSKVGPLEATIVSVDIETRENMTNGWWDTFGEGMTAREQLWMNFDGGNLRLAFGEMKDRGDGVYVHSKNKDLYWENAPAVDCDTYEKLFPPQVQ